MHKAFSDGNNYFFYTVKGNEKLNGSGSSKMNPSLFRYINPLLAVSLYKQCKKNNINIILIEHPFISWQAFLVKIFWPVKIAIRSHNIEYTRFSSGGKWFAPLVKHLETWAHKKADYNFFITLEDLNYACINFPLDGKKCAYLPYGTERNEAINQAEKFEAKKTLASLYNFDENEKIILFNGTLSYFPNQDAVQSIIKFIHPELKKKYTDYKIIICGKGLNQSLVRDIAGIEEIIYTGFVDDINLYFKGSDILLNPVVEGGGVKTKLVEALGFGKPVVSYKSGSYGVNPDVTGGRLHIIEDYNAQEIVKVCLDVLGRNYEDANSLFYEKHNWNKIASNALIHLSKLVE